MEKTVQVIVQEKLRQFFEDLGLNEEVQQETRIFGGTAKLNSVQFVAFVSDLEEALYDTYQVELSLVNEKALSQTKSPFRDVSTMAGYIEDLMKEARA